MTDKPDRLLGLDLARFIAFCGMALVNFRIVAVSAPHDGAFVSFLEGKAAALFVVLAGIGLGLAAKNARLGWQVTLKRAAFLMLIGLLNMLIFPADIIHYYAAYFALGYWFLGLSPRALIGMILLVSLVSLLMLVGLNYEAGWNWQSLDYSDFWTVPGFVRNLFFNGWHPVFPWIGFLFAGFFIARLDLAKRSVQVGLTVFGLAFAATISAASSYLTGISPAELVDIWGTSPIPPTPFYLFMGIGGACAMVGASLLVSGMAWINRVLSPLQRAGRMSLTLYFAHILIGMGVMEALAMSENLSEAQSIVFTLIFCVGAVVFARLWAFIWHRGPLEELMRRIAG